MEAKVSNGRTEARSPTGGSLPWRIAYGLGLAGHHGGRHIHRRQGGAAPRRRQEREHDQKACEHEAGVKDVLLHVYLGTDLLPSRRDGMVSSSYRPTVKVGIYPEGAMLKLKQAVLSSVGKCKEDLVHNRAWEAASMMETVQWRP